jgi:beta-galactosidase
VARAAALLADKEARNKAGSETLGPRERLLMDFDWKFILGNADDPLLDLGFGKAHGTFSKSGKFDFSTQAFDDSKWRSVNLPHDWAVELPFVNDPILTNQGYKPLGRQYPATCVGWYRRKFPIPKEDEGRRISIQFDGAVRDAMIFLNGYFIGRNDNAYAPFTFDLSDYIHYGGDNFLAVRMDTSYSDGWFYEGAGVYRHVWLNKTSALHLGQWESYVRTEIKADRATLSLGTIVQNAGGDTDSCRVEWQILDAAQKEVARGEAPTQTIAAGSDATFTAGVTLDKPALWSLETPTLYTALITVRSDKKTLDVERVSFGVRSAVFDANKGFLLNGKRVELKGTCNHQDHAGVGVAMPDRLQWYRLGVLQDMGSNAVRTSHNMPTPEWVEACDHMGMLMMCETRMMSASEEGLAQLELMVKRYRNSPAVILWSLGNEEKQLQTQPTGELVMRTMVAHAHRLDPTRMCTAAINGPNETGASKSVDVVGFNYQLGDIEGFHRLHPERPLVGTETSNAMTTRGIYETNKKMNWTSAYDPNYPPWHEKLWWPFYAEREWLAGEFAWTGFDYRGEPSPYKWPSISSQFGIVDTCGFAKDNFYYYKAAWSEEPVMHLFPHWNWKKGQSEPVGVWVYSNLDEVELFLNGQSQGVQKMKPLSHLIWEVSYEPGTIEARGSRGGKVVLIEKRETTGEPVSIRLKADRTSIAADGEDLSMVRIEVVDNQGRPVPTAENKITFRVTGVGALLGVGNGDPNCHESDKGNERSLFSGLAQAIIQSYKTPGEIVLEASAEGLTSAKVTLTAKKVPLRPSL